jgi:hypothetical protein
MIKLPPGFDADDKRAADEMGRNLRSNEKAHIVLPPMWEVLTLKIEGNSVDALASAKHHEEKLYDSVLAGFMGDSGDPETKLELFNKATRFIADQIRDVVNKWAIPELVNFNWLTVDDYPELRVRRIGETTDWRTLSFAIRNLVGANVIKPDDLLEDWIRDEMDLSQRDPATTREPVTPQGGAGVKPSPAKSPRQGKPSTQPPKQSGGDQSGG